MSNRKLAGIALALALVSAPFVANAQEDMDHTGHDMTMMEGASPSTEAFVAANTLMHKDMAIEYSGNADVDFVRGMIPHHQGAVEMAKIVLQYGTDPEVRKLAEGVIAAQEAEITWMQDWLAKNAP